MESYCQDGANEHHYARGYCEVKFEGAVMRTITLG